MKRLLTCLAAGTTMLTASAGNSPAPRLDGPEVVKLDWSTRSLQAVDLNHDGRLDLAVVNNDRGRIDLLLQTEPGKAAAPDARRPTTVNRWEPVLEDARFTKDNFVTGITVYDLVVADLDGDHRPDLVYTGDPDALTIVHQKSDGTWGEKQVIEIATPSQIVGNLRVGDLNGDGRPDIAVLGQKELSLLFQQADGSFSRPARYLLTDDNLFGLTLTDVNHDGRVDLLYLANHPREPMRVRYQGRTPGEFGPELAYSMEPARSSVQVLPGGKDQSPSYAYIEQRTGQLGIVRLQPRTGNGAESRSAVNDMPALQSGFDGPAGKRAARSPSSVTLRISVTPRSTTSAFSGFGPTIEYECATRRSIRAYAALARSTTAAACALSIQTRPSGRGGRRSTGLCADGYDGVNAGFASRSWRSSCRIAQKRAKCESVACLGAPSPCTTIALNAASAVFEQITRSMPFRPISAGESCRPGSPQNAAFSPIVSVKRRRLSPSVS